MPEQYTKAAQAPSGRLAGLDAFRGLIMALMALDHARDMIARIYYTELWSKPPPAYGDALHFLARFLTHICAPGFFLLMGVGAAFFAASRARSGWTAGRTSAALALRGLVLIALQFCAENPAWSLASEGKLAYVPYFGVLYGLGATLLFWSGLVRLPDKAVLPLSLAAIAATQILVPALGQAGGTPVWLAALLIPGGESGAYVLYPPVAWLGVTGVGLCLGRLMLDDADRARAWLFRGGLFALAAFFTLRSAGIGDFHPKPSSDWTSFLSLTKYPPSIDYLLLTLGAASLLLHRFLAVSGEPGRLRAALSVFGRAPLFFYLAHLYVFAVIGLALPLSGSLAAAIALWPAVLALLYPACARYARFKLGRPAASLWRLL